MPRPKPLILTILDGWGFSPAVEGNAIAAARKPVIEVIPHPNDYPGEEPQRRCPDITMAREDLGFNPIVTLEEGLRRFLTWSEKEYKGNSVVPS